MTSFGMEGAEETGLDVGGLASDDGAVIWGVCMVAGAGRVGTGVSTAVQACEAPTNIMRRVDEIIAESRISNHPRSKDVWL